MITKKMIDTLEKDEFINVATCDFNGTPKVAPKFILKISGNTIYLVDYTISAIWRNLKLNPRVSLSFMNPHTLIGYQLNGIARIVDKGPAYKKMQKEMQDKAIRLTAKHIIEDVQGGSEHEAFEILIRDRFIIFQVRVDEVVEIGIKGELTRRNASASAKDEPHKKSSKMSKKSLVR